jgi:hypothetical protein
MIEGAMLVVPSLQCRNTSSSLHALYVCSFFAFCVKVWSIFQSCFAFCGTSLSILQFFLVVVMIVMEAKQFQEQVFITI